MENEFISSSGSRASSASRSARTWRAMMSRKLSPSLASSSDFAALSPMLVPRPPFSRRTIAFWSASRSASESWGRSSSAGSSLTGSIESSGIRPVSPASSWR